MIAGLLVLLGCQLAGEYAVRALDLPVPGPVVGLVLLLVVLQVREPAPTSGLARVCDGMLDHLQLLFVPAGVGVVQYLSLLAASAVPLAVGLAVSWVAGLLTTAAVCAGTLALFSRRHRRAAVR